MIKKLASWRVQEGIVKYQCRERQPYALAYL